MTQEAPRHLPASERLRRAGVASWSLIGIAIVVGLAGWGLLKLRVIFPPLVLAVLLIYILNPLVSWLERRGVRRVAGTLLAFTAFLGVLTTVLALTIPFVSRQVSSFSDEFPEFRRKTITFVEESATDLEDRLGVELDTSQIECLLGADDLEGFEEAPTAARCDEVTEEVRDRLVAQAGNFTQIGRSILEVLLILILGPLIALYLLIDLPHIQRDMLNLVPESHREEARDFANKIGRAVGGFFRGQLLVALSVGLMSAVGFRIIGLPFWFVVGGIAGFFNLVPLIGPFIGGGIGFLIGIMTDGIGLGLKAALVELIVQQIDNHFISPQIMKRTVKLHPATVVLALLAGGNLAGFWGIFLAVPAVAVVKIVLSHVWATRVLQVEPTPHSHISGPAPPPEPDT